MNIKINWGAVRRTTLLIALVLSSMVMIFFLGTKGITKEVEQLLYFIALVSCLFILEILPTPPSEVRVSSFFWPFMMIVILITIFCSFIALLKSLC